MYHGCKKFYVLLRVAGVYAIMSGFLSECVNYKPES